MKIKRIRQILIPILFIAFASSITWTYISVKAKPQPLPEKDISLSVTPDYKIISRKPLMVWPSGTVFEQGMAAYFYAADPVVTLTPVIEASGLEQGLIQGTVKSRVSLQAVNDKSQLYWSYLLKQTPSESFSMSPAEAGQAGPVTFTAADILLDVPAAYQTITYISNELTFQNAVFQMVVTTDVQVNGSANGISIDKSFTQALPLTLEQSSFSIPEPQDIQSQFSFQNKTEAPSLLQFVLSTVRQNYIPFAANAALLLLLLFLLSPDNATKSKELREHRRFKEWITEGSVEIKDKSGIHILSLEGLVDLAIDLDKRVIFDPSVNKYYVLTEDLVYIYDSERAHALLENREMLGKLLLKRGILSPEQLEMGLYYQKKNGIKLGQSLTALGFIDETTLYSTLAAQQQINYYELNSKKDFIDTALLDTVGLQKARALMAIPLGERTDGRLAVACSDTARKDIQSSLEELFGRQISIAAVKPSVIYEVLEAAASQKTDQENITSPAKNKAPSERISEKEREQFIASYKRGIIPQTLFLKASGLVEPAILEQVPEHSEALNWLVSKNYADSEFANLIKGLNKAVEAMDWNMRQEKQIPSLCDLLFKSNYLTSETLEWIHRELAIQTLSAEELLRNNFLASEATVKKAETILSTLESLLYKSERS